MRRSSRRPDERPFPNRNQGQPTKALDDAVYSAAMLLQDRPSRDRRKIILLISDGQNGAKFNTHNHDDTRAELLRQGITVYSVAVGSAYLSGNSAGSSNMPTIPVARCFLARRARPSRISIPASRAGPQPVHPGLFAKWGSQSRLPRTGGPCAPRGLDHPHPQRLLRRNVCH